MNIKLSSAFILPALALVCLTSSSFAQNSCKNVPVNPTPDQTAGCIPLTFHPLDGGPVQTVWTQANFIGPVPALGRTSTAGASATKRLDLDLGLTAFYVRPDFGQSVNVDVGGFVALTGKYFGVEVDAADTVRSGNGIHEPYIVAGPRVQYRTRHFTVLAKAQAGAGHFSGAPGQFNNKQTLIVENYGAAVEFKISRHLKLRAIDANYQIWPTFAPNNLSPLHIGSGIAFSL